MELAENDAESLNLLLKVGNALSLHRRHVPLYYTGSGFFKGHRGAGVPHCIFS